MKINDIKEKWKQFRDQKGYVQRVDPMHPMDFFIGISEQGYDELVLFTTEEPASLRSSKALEIKKNQRASDKKWATQICLVEKQNEDIFAKLCVDLIESSQNVSSEQEGIARITKRFLAWQKLFATVHTGLPKHVLKGLFGELSFANDILSNYYTWDRIMEAWQGPDGADRDYVFQDNWYEVKSVATGKDKITISSLNQLETDGIGYLVRFDVDDSSSTDPNALSVASLVHYIREKISTIPNALFLFEQKLVSIGYIDRQEYENVFFVHKPPIYYLVDDLFPRLITTSVPTEVVGAKYDLSLVGIDPWRKEPDQVWK